MCLDRADHVLTIIEMCVKNIQKLKPAFFRTSLYWIKTFFAVLIFLPPKFSSKCTDVFICILLTKWCWRKREHKHNPVSICWVLLLFEHYRNMPGCHSADHYGDMWPGGWTASQPHTLFGSAAPEMKGAGIYPADPPKLIAMLWVCLMVTTFSVVEFFISFSKALSAPWITWATPSY